MPKSTSEFAHDKDSRALNQIREVFPFVNPTATTDHNTNECLLFFTVEYDQPPLATFTNAATDFSVTVTVRNGLNDLPCEWFQGIVDYELVVNTAGDGTAAIENAGSHVTFVDGKGTVTISTAATWAENDYIVVRPAGDIWGHTLSAPANYVTADSTITAPAA
tara:strand:- start:12 stop:500 length:489 start_codon:yes stop_codon:yes gene_type:complete